MTDRSSNMDNAQEAALLADTERLATELGLRDQDPAHVLGNSLSRVPAAMAERRVLAGRDKSGEPVWTLHGQPHNGYAPDWLIQAIPPQVSTYRHWVDGVLFAGFNLETSLGDLMHELRGVKDHDPAP